PRDFPGVGRALLGAAVALAWLAPWLAYQRFYDPPGDRLVKWHLAGVIPVDERPAAQALRDAYAQTSPRELLLNRWENLLVLVGRPWRAPPEQPPGQSPLSRWRNAEYYNVVPALGLLNLGWLGLLGRRPDGPARRAGGLLALGLAGLAVWVLLMFGPGTTYVYQGSFTTMMLVFLGLGAVVSGWPWAWRGPLLALSALDFAVVWAGSGGP